MKNKKKPFRVRPIRHSWHEKFWKKQTLRAHHGMLFALVLVLGVAFGFEAVFGADVAAPYFNPSAPLTSPPPPAIDAAAPNTPTGAPSGASTVTPKFSGANIQGLIFNQADGDVQAKDSIIQLYDYTNVWGQLNAINGIVNGGYAGQGIDPYMQGTALEPFSPAVVIDDVIDNRAAGIMDTGGGATLGFVSVWDAFQIDPLKASPTLGPDSSNRIMLLNNDFGEADIEFNSPSRSPTVWEIGTGRTDEPFEFYIDSDVGPRFAINEANGTTTVNQDLTVNGTLSAPLIQTSPGGAIGNFYLTPPVTSSDNLVTRSATATCLDGDTLVACGGFQSGTNYKYQGSLPSGLSCVASSFSMTPEAVTVLSSYAFCFSPDG